MEKGEKVSLASLDIGSIIKLNEDSDNLYQLIDCEIIEYRDNVWALSDAETGDFEGLVRDGDGEGNHAVMVYYHGETL